MFNLDPSEFPLVDALRQAREEKQENDLKRDAGVLLEVSEDMEEIAASLAKQVRDTEHLLNKQQSLLEEVKVALRYFEDSGGNFLPFAKTVDKVIEKDVFDNVYKICVKSYLGSMNRSVPDKDSPLWKVTGAAEVPATEVE